MTKDIVLMFYFAGILLFFIRLFFLLFFTTGESLKRKQFKLSENILNQLILAHESKRLVCSQLLVSDVYKQVLVFNQQEIIADSNSNFLGAWNGIPVFYNSAIKSGDAIALADNPGFPSTTTSELKL